MVANTAQISKVQSVHKMKEMKCKKNTQRQILRMTKYPYTLSTREHSAILETLKLIRSLKMFSMMSLKKKTDKL